jgi:hypothetical protein
MSKHESRSREDRKMLGHDTEKKSGRAFGETGRMFFLIR